MPWPSFRQQRSVTALMLSTGVSITTYDVMLLYRYNDLRSLHIKHASFIAMS